MIAAARLIPSPKRKDDLRMSGYQTGDIVKEVLDTYRESRDQIKDFALSLRADAKQSDYESCKKIFDFIKQNIRYQVDPALVQLVKTPARLYADRVGDCKSFSIFAASCLYALGLPGCFRFVSFSSSPIPTHVYVVAYPGGKEIKIDAVIEKFDTEKQYTYKIDYDMNSLYRLSGVGAAAPAKKLAVVDAHYKKGKALYNPKPGEFQLPVMSDGSTSDELIEAAILKQRLEIEAAMMNRVAGIGNPSVSVAQQAIADLDARIKAAVSGIDDYHVSGGIFKKIVNTVKKIALAPVKLAQKVVMAPVALILNKQLPDSAMAFLYIFIPDGVCEKMPAKVCSKRKKQMNMMKVICNFVQIKESHFRDLVQNGIMKKTGKTPVAYLSEQFKIQISGEDGKVGIWGVIIGFVLKLVQVIVGLFKKKSKDLPANEKEAAEMVPDETDWAVSPNSFQATEVSNTLANAAAKQTSTLEKVLTTAGAVADTITQVSQTYQQANELQSVQAAPVDYSQYSTGSNYNNYSTANAYDADTLQSATVKASATQASLLPAGMDTNKLVMFGGLGLLAFMALRNSGGRKN